MEKIVLKIDDLIPIAEQSMTFSFRGYFIATRIYAPAVFYFTPSYNQSERKKDANVASDVTIFNSV